MVNYHDNSVFKSGLKPSYQVLHFSIGDMHCCIELENIDRVIPLTAMQQLPGASAAVVGLLNLHGMGIPVVDLLVHIGTNTVHKYNLDTSIILLRHEDSHIGLITDKIQEIATYPLHQLQLQSKFDQANQPFLCTINANQHLCFMLAIDRIMAIKMANEQEQEVSAA